jgi:hypothetical protein
MSLKLFKHQIDLRCVEDLDLLVLNLRRALDAGDIAGQDLAFDRNLQRPMENSVRVAHGTRR